MVRVQPGESEKALEIVSAQPVPGAPGVRLKGVVGLAVEATRTRRREGKNDVPTLGEPLSHTAQWPPRPGS